MSILQEISEALQQGKRKAVTQLVDRAINEGIPAQIILNDGLLAGMGVIGEKFKNNEVFVPEVLIAARAMNEGAAMLKQLLTDEGAEPVGKACIGTVKGDLHDIGKNLVKMMLEGRGIEVVDLGVDVPAEKFHAAAMENGVGIVCCSALLTTTMGEMKNIVEYFIRKGDREKVKIMIGGAPITQTYCDMIGADAYTPDAATAAEVAYSFFRV
jgi:methanogenic corrinoid protein MtbC1